MPRHGRKSKAELATVTLRLRQLFQFVIQFYDHSILEGRRSRGRQSILYSRRQSKVAWPDSKHNVLHPNDLARAVDAGPYDHRVRGVKWDTDLLPREAIELLAKHGYKINRDALKNLMRFYSFGGFVKGAAAAMGIGIRWGGDWDGDTFHDDQTFDDLVHFEETDN